MSGKAAVENAVAGITDKMVGFQCTRDNGKYVCKTELLNLTDVANTEKKVPLEWINKEHNGVEQPFIDYVLPLIQGEPNLPKVDSLPRFAKLKKGEKAAKLEALFSDADLRSALGVTETQAARIDAWLPEGMK